IPQLVAGPVDALPLVDRSVGGVDLQSLTAVVVHDLAVTGPGGLVVHSSLDAILLSLSRVRCQVSTVPPLSVTAPLTSRSCVVGIFSKAYTSLESGTGSQVTLMEPFPGLPVTPEDKDCRASRSDAAPPPPPLPITVLVFPP